MGGGGSEGDQIQKSKHHLPSAQFGRNSFMSDFSIRMYLFIFKKQEMEIYRYSKFCPLVPPEDFGEMEHGGRVPSSDQRESN